MDSNSVDRRNANTDHVKKEIQFQTVWTKKSGFRLCWPKESCFRQVGQMKSSFRPSGPKESSFRPCGKNKPKFRPCGPKKSGFRLVGSKKPGSRPCGSKIIRFRPLEQKILVQNKRHEVSGIQIVWYRKVRFQTLCTKGFRYQTKVFNKNPCSETTQKKSEFYWMSICCISVALFVLFEQKVN